MIRFSQYLSEEEKKGLAAKAEKSGKGLPPNA